MFELRIEKLVAGGDGLGRHHGRVVFVPRSAPGDRLLVEPEQSRRDYLRAGISRILEPSPHRRQSPCPFYARCGGCSTMHLQPEAQVEAKRQILLESLRRGGRIDFRGEVHLRTGAEARYRARARLHVKKAARGLVIGFRERGSHRVVDVSHCLQLSETANGVLGRLRRWLTAKGQLAGGLVLVEILEPSGEPEPTGPPRSGVEIAGGPSRQGRPVAHLVVKTGKVPLRSELERLRREADLAGLWVSEEGPARNGPAVLEVGQSRLIHRVAGFEFQAGSGSFFQTNRFLLDALVEEVVPVDKSGLGWSVDLYCGVGLFSLPLAFRARRVDGVDASAPAIADARANAARAGADNIAFHCETAAEYAARNTFQSCDLVVADPPRGGLESAVREALCEVPPRELRYVSCDPAALGRDAGRLVTEGPMKLQRLVLLDFFPNTHHFETVATFKRD
ncbi:MAG: class I SAM-dependent RNA methyltransferase [Acidobacteriota bacterium]